MENLHGRSRAPNFSPQQLVKGRGGSFENADLDSPFFLRYLRGSLSPPSPIDGRRNRHLSPLSPLSPVENLMAAARSPQPREEVLVMDGVLVTGGGKRSSRSWSGGSGSPSVASSDSSSGKSFYKGQFVHGKENLHHTRYSGKNKSEAQSCKSTPSPGPSPKSRFASQVMSSAGTDAASSSPKPNSTSKDWSPQDDGIEVLLPSSTDKPTSKEDLDAYINDFLFGPTAKKRLPVFAEISSD